MDREVQGPLLQSFPEEVWPNDRIVFNIHPVYRRMSLAGVKAQIRKGVVPIEEEKTRGPECLFCFVPTLSLGLNHHRLK